MSFANENRLLSFFLIGPFSFRLLAYNADKHVREGSEWTWWERICSSFHRTCVSWGVSWKSLYQRSRHLFLVGRVFSSWRGVTFVKSIFLDLSKWSWDLSFLLLMQSITLTDFGMLDHWGSSFHLGMDISFLYTTGFSLPVFFEDFYIYIRKRYCSGVFLWGFHVVLASGQYWSHGMGNVPSFLFFWRVCEGWVLIPF